MIFYKHPTSEVSKDAFIGEGTKIWHFCHVMEGARIGERCARYGSLFVKQKKGLLANV